MSTLREQAVAAVVERLAAVGTFTVTRNETAPATIDHGGYVVVRDGVREEVDRTLGIASYWITHRISVEAIVGGGDPNGALDAPLQAIEQALAAEPQLAPGVTFVECDLADIETISADGAETWSYAVLETTWRACPSGKGRTAVQIRENVPALGPPIIDQEEHVYRRQLEPA